MDPLLDWSDELACEAEEAEMRLAELVTWLDEPEVLPNELDAGVDDNPDDEPVLSLLDEELWDPTELDTPLDEEL